MNKMKRLEIVFDRIFNKLFKVTSIEKLLKQQEDMNNTLNSVIDSKNSLKGAIINNKAELKVKKEQLEKIEQKIEKYIVSENKSKAEEGYVYKLQLEKDINRLKLSIDANEKILVNTEKQIEVYKKKIGQISNNINELKAKDEFTRNANEFKSNMRALECEDIKDITDEINKEYYAQTCAIEDIKESEKDVDDFLEKDKDGFNEYMEKIQKKMKKNKKEV